MKQKDYEWIKSIIASCKHQFHLQCVDVLIELFAARHQDEDLKLNLQLEKQYKESEVMTNIAN